MCQDFTKDEINVIRTALVREAPGEVELHLARSDVQLQPGDTLRTPCPTVSWHQRDANFVIIKTGPQTFRTRFFYTPHDQYDTGKHEYNSLEECVAAVIRAQRMHKEHE